MFLKHFNLLCNPIVVLLPEYQFPKRRFPNDTFSRIICNTPFLNLYVDHSSCIAHQIFSKRCRNKNDCIAPFFIAAWSLYHFIVPQDHKHFVVIGHFKQNISDYPFWGKCSFGGIRFNLMGHSGNWNLKNLHSKSSNIIKFKLRSSYSISVCFSFLLSSLTGICWSGNVSNEEYEV